MSEGGGENLGSMTIRVVRAGSTGSTAPSESSGASAARMPSQAPPVPPPFPTTSVVHRPPVSSSGSGGGSGAPSHNFTAAGVANVIAQSTTNPYGSAVGAASMIGSGSLAGPLLIVGGIVAAATGAVLALRSAVNSLTSRMGEVARFGPLTMQASMRERVAAFQRQIYRAQAGDVEFAGLQTAITSLSNRLTPLVSGLERMGAVILTRVLTSIESLLVAIAQTMQAIGPVIAQMPGGWTTLGNSITKLGNDILAANHMTAHPNDIFQRQLAVLTQGRQFGQLLPAPAPTP